MTADRDRIRAYYAMGAEDDRLAGPDGWFELVRTVRIVQGLVPAGSRIVDLGGGPGRLTAALAERGYRMTLVDLSGELVGIAEKRLADTGLAADGLHVGDALSFSTDEPFDAVLSFGPLYHLSGEPELRPMVEAHAGLLRPGGVLIGSFIPLTTGLSGLIARAASSPDQVPAGTFREVLETGRFRNTTTEGFCEVWFAEPSQVVTAYEAAGLHSISIQSLRSVSAPYGAELQRVLEQTPDVYEEYLGIIEETAHRPDAIGMGWHAVAVGYRN